MEILVGISLITVLIITVILFVGLIYGICYDNKETKIKVLDLIEKIQKYLTEHKNHMENIGCEKDSEEIKEIISKLEKAKCFLEK